MPKQINVKLGFEADTSQAKKQIQDLQKSLDNLMTSSTKNTALKDFSKDMVEAQQSAVKLKSILGESMNLDTGRLDLVKFNQQLQDSGLTLSKLGSQLSSLGPEGKQAFLSLADSIVTAQKPMVETNKLLDGMWTALKNTARWQLSSSMLHGFMSALSGAYGYAQDLNASLNSIRIVSGQSVEQMAAFAEQANRSAQALSTSTLAYTDAALIFYQQGLTGDAVTERVDTVLKLSNVTGDSAEQVSSYMTAIWNNFYDGSQSLESFADKITALGAATASSSAEIASGLQQFAAIGNTVGLSYDYAATALATIVAQTRQSESTVGNGLRTIFARLSSLKQGGTDEDGTDLTKYTKALAEYDIQVKDQNGNLKEMDQILNEIGAKWQTLSDTQKVALAQTVGGVRQYATIMALFDNWDDFQRNLGVAQNAEGTLQEQADIYAESWEAARKRVQAAWQAIYQDLIDDKFFINILNGLAEILKGVDYLIDRIGGLKGVLATVGIAVTQLFSKQIETGIKNTVTNLNKIFYGDKIQAALAQQAEKAAKEQLTYKKEDVANDTIIENQILQIELNEKIRQRKLQINDADKEYYQSLLKISGELAKQNALLADRQLASNKELADVEEGMLYKLYNSPNLYNNNDEHKKIEDAWVKILNNQDNEFDEKVKSTLNENGELDPAGLKSAIDYLKQYNQQVKYTDEELKKLIQIRRENLSLTKLTGEEAQKQAVFDAAITAIIGQGVNSEEAYAQAIQDRINALAQENGISAERLQAIEKDIQETGAQTENYSEQEKQILNLIKAKQALNNEDENGELHQYIKKKTDPNLGQNPSRIGIQINTDKIVKAAQGISQITMGISSLTTAIKTFGDKSIPVTERFSNVIMSVTMALPGLITGISTLADVLSITFWQMTAIVAVIGGLIWVFKELQKNTPEGRLAELNNKLDEQKQKVAELKSEYDKLSSALGNYKNKLEEINKLEGPQKAAAIAEYNAEIIELIKSLDNYEEVIGKLKFNEDGLIELSDDDITNLINAKSMQYVHEQLELGQDQINQNEQQKIVNNNAAAGARITNAGYISSDIAKDVLNSGIVQDWTPIIKGIFQEAGITSTSSRSEQEKALQEAIEQGKAGNIKTEDIDRIIQAIHLLSQNDEQRTNFDNSSENAKLDIQSDAQRESNYRLALSPSTTFETLTDESQQRVFEALETADVTDLQKLFDILTENPGTALVDALKQIGIEVNNLVEDATKVEEAAHNIKTVIDADMLNNYSGSTEELAQDVNDLSDYIQNNIDKLTEFDEHLKECRKETERVAYSIIRFDDAIQDVQENYKDWMDILGDNGTFVEQVKLGKELQKVYGNLLDIDQPEFLGSEFTQDAENLKLMEEATRGVASSYDELAEKAARSIILNIDPTTSIQQLDGWLATVQSDMDRIQEALGRELRVGENINDAALYQHLNDIIANTASSVEEAQAILQALGYDAIVRESKDTKEDDADYVDVEAELVPETGDVTAGVFGGISSGISQAIAQSVHYKAGNKQTVKNKKTNTVSALEIVPGSLHKKASGTVKYQHAPSGGGTKGSSGSGGGGGSKGSQPKKKTVKEHKKPEQKTDRYHDIKERIADLNTELKRLEKTENRIYGKGKLKYMDEEIKRLEKQIELTDEYIDEIKKYAKEDQARLRGIGMGATFDDDGRLNNYEQVLANIVASYNSAVATYNGAVDTFNASAQEDADNARLEAADKALAAAKETYDERLKILDQYEDTFNLLQEKWDARIDQVWELFDKRLEQITWKIEFELDWNEKELDHFDWLLKYVGKDADYAADAIANLSKQMGIYAESIDWAKEGISEIFGLHGINFDFDNADPDELNKQLATAMQLMQLESQLTEDEANALLKYMDTLKDSYDGMYDSWIDAHDHMMNAWDEWQDRLKEGIDDIAQYGKELEGIQKIIELTGRKMLKMSTNDLNRMNQAIVTNAQENLRAATARRNASVSSVEFAAQHLQELIDGGAADEAIQLARDEYRKMVEDFNDATNDWYSAFADALSAGEDAFEAFIENTTKDYKEAFGKMDLDYMQEQFKRQKDVRDLYLDDYQKYHELNKTAQELNKSLAATNNTLIRDKLLDLQDDMNASMQTGVQISAAQAEIYARRLALLQAEAELLDAQNAKSAVRMTRDNEGNFSYTYTADQEQIGEAQQNYGDKFYELLQYERDYADQIQEEMLDSFQEFIDRRNEIAETYKDDQDAYNQAMEDLQEEYLAYMDYYVGELDMDMYEMARLRDDDWLDFERLTGNKLAEHDDFIEHFHETIVGNLMPDYQTAGQLAQQWRGVMEESCRASDKAVSNYQKNTQTTFEHAGENINTYGLKVTTKFDEIAEHSSDTADAVEDMGKDMVETMGDIQTETYELDSTWTTVMENMRTEISNTITALGNLLQKLQDVQYQAKATIAAVQAAAAISAANGYNSGISGDYGSYDSGSGSAPTSKNPGGKQPPNITTQTTQSSVGRTAHVAVEGGHGVHVQVALPAFDAIDITKLVPHKASGGYTGSWGGPDGHLELLHDKEYVLNKEDTINMFNVVDAVRNIVNSVGSNGLLNTLALAAGGATGLIGGLGAGLEQQVHIEANFPNVQSHTEIEMAINNLINSASQYVNRKS